MKITPKSTELIQSQVAEFARAGEIDHFEASALNKHIGEVAARPVTDFKIVDTKSDIDPTRLVEIPEEKYLNFLRKGGVKLKESLKFHETMQHNWLDYKADIDELFNDVDSMGDPKKHPSFLGNGSSNSAFKFEKDGKQLVARRSSFRGEKHVAASHFATAPFVEGNKIDHIQHIVAADPNSEIVITELLPGKNAAELSFEERMAIPEKHIVSIIETIREMKEAGLVIDPRPTNFMYDTEAGFSILDYHASGNRIKGQQSFIDAIRGLRPILVLPVSSFSDSPKVGTKEHDEYTADIQIKTAALGNKFLDILLKNYPEIVDELAQQQKEIDNNPRKFGDVLVSTREYNRGIPEVNDFVERIESLGLTSAENKPKFW